VSHSFVTVVVPFAAGRAGDVLTLVRGMGNPAAPALRTSIESLDVVHFMSVNVIPADQGDRAHLLLEMSVDGPGEAALRGVAVALAQPLTDVLTAAGYTVSATGLPAFLSRHSRTLATTWYGTARSGGALGLAFCGSPNMPLRRIRDEAALGDLVADWSDLLYGPGPALDKLAAVRDRLWARGRWKWAFDAEQTPFLLPRRDDTPSVYARIFLASIPALLWPVLLVALLICALRWSVLHWWWIPSVVGVFALLLIVLAAVLLVLVRRAEKTDIPEDVAPSPQHVAEVMDGENHVTLNLLIVVTRLKPGWLRRFTLRAGFWVTSAALARIGVPGWLGDVGVVQFARWVLLPGTDQLVFASNYDGAWESYLEDFVELVAYGVTAVWTNCRGFPKTFLLFWKGAKDSDRFRRYVRRYQIATGFWYAAFPDLTLVQMRTNAAIRLGIAGAQTEQEAQAWLDLFSAPR